MSAYCWLTIHEFSWINIKPTLGDTSCLLGSNVSSIAGRCKIGRIYSTGTETVALHILLVYNFHVNQRVSYKPTLSHSVQ